jgi:hypothetical protein
MQHGLLYEAGRPTGYTLVLGGKERDVRSRSLPASDGTTWERSREDVLEAARPLPPDEDVVIEELSDDEDRRFLAVILDS